MLVNVVQSSCIAFCIPNNALLIKEEIKFIHRIVFKSENNNCCILQICDLYNSSKDIKNFKHQIQKKQTNHAVHLQINTFCLLSEYF